MKLISRLLIAAALLCTGSLALADQSQRGDHNQRGQGHGQNDNRHGGRHDNRPQYNNRHSNDRRPVVYRNSHGPYRGAPARWQRGHRYTGPTYVVRDYGHYHLRQPPRGYRWVRANNDYLLIAIATGIILDMAIR